jgi:glycosyltransferase involved in cell wall biosynthesis
MSPRVSVVIPTKNRANFLDLAIRSVVNQTFKDFEILIVDAASSDDTEGVVRKFRDERIRYIYQQVDRGVSASRNTGIEQSSGNYVGFLDDDDIWMPNKLEKQLKGYDKRIGVGAIFVGGYIINENGKLLGYSLPSFGRSVFPDILERNFLGNCSAVMAKKECLTEVGLFDERLKAAEDWDLWIRLAKRYEIACIPEPLILYRIHKKSITRTRAPDRLQAAELMFKKFLTDINTCKNRRRILGRWAYEFGRLYFECGDAKRGRKEFAEAVYRRPYSATYDLRLLSSVFGPRTYLLARSLLNRLLPSSFRFKVRFW